MKKITIKPSDINIIIEYKQQPEPRELTDYEKALLSINNAYDMENYDAYEQRIYRASAKFKKPYWQVEDDATDVRMFGVNGI